MTQIIFLLKFLSSFFNLSFYYFFSYIYIQRGQQRVSNIARIILGTFFILVCALAGLASFQQIHWLDFLYYCSYIKLTITLIKYIPQVIFNKNTLTLKYYFFVFINVQLFQAVMNYRRKSTVGWSIGCIFLDIIGGVFSINQMILNAYNHGRCKKIILYFIC